MISAKMKMATCATVGQSDIDSSLFTKISFNNYEKVCDADVLGLKESHCKYNDYVYEKFKKQLKRDEKLV